MECSLHQGSGQSLDLEGKKLLTNYNVKQSYDHLNNTSKALA